MPQDAFVLKIQREYHCMSPELHPKCFRTFKKQAPDHKVTIITNDEELNGQWADK